MHKPVQAVLDSLELLRDRGIRNVLDLGCGVGRHSIPIAQQLTGRSGKVICVDLLASAIEKLKAYSDSYGVAGSIEAVQADLEDFPIASEQYDLLVAISSLEHISTPQNLAAKLQEMANGTKAEGINCILINASIQELITATDEHLDPMFEINLPTAQMLELLHKQYAGWEILQETIKPAAFPIQRADKQVTLRLEVITFVARK
nr:class I SAM-dependent methyltransferase [Paenibacillus phyllosphaerae]